MTTFRSCHLIVNRKLCYDRRHAHNFIDAAFPLGGTYSPFLKWTPSTNANIFSHYFAHFGKMLSISTANDSTFIVTH